MISVLHPDITGIHDAFLEVMALQEDKFDVYHNPLESKLALRQRFDLPPQLSRVVVAME